MRHTFQDFQFKLFLIVLLIIILYIFLKSKYLSFESSKYINKLRKKLNISNEFNKIYTDLFFKAKSGEALRPIFVQKTIKSYNIEKDKGILLSTIGKKENLYIREFVGYYQQLNFSKIIIFDNNDINGEVFDYILNDYIKNNFVEIIDIRGFSSTQIAVINYCYQKYKKLYDWIAFFDIDEFLYIKDNLNINKYLYNERFQKCESIIFNWHIYDDNDLEKYENKTLIERFKNLKYRAIQSKSIIRGNLDNLLFPSVHICAINVNYFCDSTGKRIFPPSFLSTNLNENYLAYIKHFYTKTAEEFCLKLNKGDAQFKDKTIFSRIQYFFKINKITKNKIKIIENCIHLNISKLLSKYN